MYYERHNCVDPGLLYNLYDGERIIFKLVPGDFVNVPMLQELGIRWEAVA